MTANDIIGQALSGTISHDLGIARITCQATAARYITCRCGRILDQSTVRVVEVGGALASYFCDKHATDSATMSAIAADVGQAVTISTWGAVWTFQPNGDVDLSN